ncbi:unnamed protein product [Tilletia caries]|uniref:Uncharacterized protein n=1 Tax=Tilletia caries TaxID=13290 RepID=A0ABN7J6J6_9BASI|nr:unnamed protein product [Tilletia caries]
MPAETVVAATKSRYQWASDPDVKAHHPSRRERIHPFGLSTALPHLAQHPSPSHDVTTTAPPLKSLRSRHPTETSARHTLPPRLALHTSSREDSPSMPHNPCATGYSDFLSNVSKLKIIETACPLTSDLFNSRAITIHATLSRRYQSGKKPTAFAPHAIKIHQ